MSSWMSVLIWYYVYIVAALDLRLLVLFQCLLLHHIAPTICVDELYIILQHSNIPQ